MKRIIIVFALILSIGTTLWSQSIRIDSTVEVKQDQLTKEVWSYQTDETFDYVKIEYTDSRETEREYKRYEDSLNVRQETILDGIDTLETIDQVYDGAGRTIQHKRKYFSASGTYTFETTSAYEYLTGNELRTQQRTTRSADGTLLQTINNQYTYDVSRKVMRVIGQFSQAPAGRVWLDTLNYYYLNDSVTRIDVYSGYQGNTNSNEFQRIYLTGYKLNIGGDTNYVFSNETRLTGDSTVIVDQTEVKYVWGEEEPYQNHGTISTSGLKTFAYGAYEEFLAPRGDTLHSAFYTFISFDEGIEKLETYFDNKALDGYRKYFLNDSGEIEYEEEYIDTPWGEKIIRSKRYYYSGLVSSHEERSQKNARIAIINHLDRDRVYFTIDGKRINQIRHTQVLIEMDWINRKARKVIFIPQ